LRENYRTELDRIIKQELVDGGGISYIMDPNDSQDNSRHLGKVVGRTSSLNPKWYQDLEPNNKLSPKEARIAVDKALNGDDLGVKEARFISVVLDQIKDSRVSGPRYDYAVAQREEHRALLKEIEASRLRNGRDF